MGITINTDCRMPRGAVLPAGAEDDERALDRFVEKPKCTDNRDELPTVEDELDSHRANRQ